MPFEVLVFDGLGICPDSRTGLLRALYSILSPNYWIGAVDQTQLRSGKWTHTCSLLALPHCSDVEVYSRLGQDSEAIEQIREFVQSGGSFLGIGGGAFFASAQANWVGRMVGPTALALWPGTSTGPCLRGGPHLHDLSLNIDNNRYQCYLFWEDGGEFERAPRTDVLARYNDEKSVAAIHHVSGEGNVVLWHARLECALGAQLVRGTCGMPNFSDEEIMDFELCRRKLFKRTLQTLGLVLPDKNSPQPPRLPFPQLLVAQLTAQPNPARPENAFVDLWDLQDSPPLYNDKNETFRILPPRCAMPQEWDTLRRQSQSAPQSTTWVVSPYRIPPVEVTRLFNIARYFRELAHARGTDQVSNEFGRYLLYGEAVASTHTQLIGNPLVANLLPSPLLSLATFQLKGICYNTERAWLSPYGVLQWTLMLEVPSQFSRSVQSLDAAVRIVSLAVVEACRPLLREEYRLRLGLKWPNDIYIASENSLEKLGGVLVEPLPGTVSGGTRRILIGCGLDVCNSRPLPALETFADRQYLRDGKLPMELVAARIMAQLSIAWEQFSQNHFSFEDFTVPYSNVLLHNGGQAKFRTERGETPCTIKGVDNQGRLRIAGTHPQTGEVISPDRFLAAREFSFDIHRNILYRRGHA